MRTFVHPQLLLVVDLYASSSTRRAIFVSSDAALYLLYRLFLRDHTHVGRSVDKMMSSSSDGVHDLPAINASTRMLMLCMSGSRWPNLTILMSTSMSVRSHHSCFMCRHILRTVYSYHRRVPTKSLISRILTSMSVRLRRYQ